LVDPFLFFGVFWQWGDSFGSFQDKAFWASVIILFSPSLKSFYPKNGREAMSIRGFFWFDVRGEVCRYGLFAFLLFFLVVFW